MAQAKKKTASKKKTVKRKAATKPKAEVVQAEPCTGLVDASAIGAATEVLMAAVEDYREEMSSLSDDGELRQDQVAVARFAAFARSSMGALEEIFSATALRLRQTGSVETGPLRVDYDMQPGRQSPKWKDIAVKLAGELADLKNRDFEAEAYAAQVKAETKKSPDKHKATIREADGPTGA
jgi:hypothetical protein